MPFNEIVQANVIALGAGLESGRLYSRLFCRSSTRPAGAFLEASAVCAGPRAAGVHEIRTASEDDRKPRATGGPDAVGRILNGENLILGNT